MVIFRNYECDDYQFCLSSFAKSDKVFNCNGCTGNPKETIQPKKIKPKKEKNKMKDEGEDDEKLGLIEKAKSKVLKQKTIEFDKEEFDLAVLWLKGEVANRQVNFAYDSRGEGGLVRMAKVVKEMYAQKKLILK